MTPRPVPVALLVGAVLAWLLAMLEPDGVQSVLAMAVAALAGVLAVLWAAVAALREQTERELVAIQSRLSRLEERPHA
jgi:small basic protein